MYGTPGPVYIDMPADVIFSKINESEISYFPLVEPLPKLQLSSSQVEQTIALLRSAKSPLVIVGKGVAYGNAENEMRAFIERSNLPFLATPMGKGIVKDTDLHSAGSARTFVL
jgi:thiamine pyrophosphate-dependent acetolactate synthase large subunit-like protein